MYAYVRTTLYCSMHTVYAYVTYCTYKLTCEASCTCMYVILNKSSVLDSTCTVKCMHIYALVETVHFLEMKRPLLLKTYCIIKLITFYNSRKTLLTLHLLLANDELR